MKMTKFVIFVKKTLKINLKICKVRDHCHDAGKYKSAANSICNLRHSVPKSIPLAFQNGPDYDYHFIIKELAVSFFKKIICLGENTEKIYNRYSYHGKISYKN